LQVAVKNRRKDSVVALVQLGASVNDLSPYLRDRNSILHHAAMLGDISMGELLISLSADVHALNAQGLTFVDVARYRGHKEFVAKFHTSLHMTDEDTVVSLMKCGGYALTNQSYGSQPAIKWWQEMFKLPEAYQTVTLRPVEVIVDKTLVECRRLAFNDMQLPTTEQEFNGMVNSYGDVVENEVNVPLLNHLRLLLVLFEEIIHGCKSEMVLAGLSQLAFCVPLLWKLNILYYSTQLLKPAISGQFAWDVGAWCVNVHDFFFGVRELCLKKSQVGLTFVRVRLDDLLAILQLLGNTAIDMRREWLMPKSKVDKRKY
jgi:hypothetical protein